MSIVIVSLLAIIGRGCLGDCGSRSPCCTCSKRKQGTGFFELTSRALQSCRSETQRQFYRRWKLFTAAACI